MMSRVLRGLVLMAVFGFWQTGTADAARYVPIEVLLYGEVILSGNASDNGRPDADEVWDALKEVNLGETEAFAKLEVDAKAKEYAVQGEIKKGIFPIVIKVAYGGRAETRFLKLKRMAPDGAGRVWRISTGDVDDLFLKRMVSRRDVIALDDPRLEKRR